MILWTRRGMSIDGKKWFNLFWERRRNYCTQRQSKRRINGFRRVFGPANLWEEAASRQFFNGHLLNGDDSRGSECSLIVLTDEIERRKGRSFIQTSLLLSTTHWGIADYDIPPWNHLILLVPECQWERREIGDRRSSEAISVLILKQQELYSIEKGLVMATEGDRRRGRHVRLQQNEEGNT